MVAHVLAFGAISVVNTTKLWLSSERKEKKRKNKNQTKNHNMVGSQGDKNFQHFTEIGSRNDKTKHPYKQAKTNEKATKDRRERHDDFRFEKRRP